MLAVQLNLVFFSTVRSANVNVLAIRKKSSSHKLHTLSFRDAISRPPLIRLREEFLWHLDANLQFTFSKSANVFFH